MNIQFEITPQRRQLRGRGNRVAVRSYTEDGAHRGAVAVMAADPQRGPVVTVSKPVSPEGLLRIAEALIDEAKTWPPPEPVEPDHEEHEVWDGAPSDLTP